MSLTLPAPGAALPQLLTAPEAQRIIEELQPLPIEEVTKLVAIGEGRRAWAVRSAGCAVWGANALGNRPTPGC